MDGQHRAMDLCRIAHDLGLIHERIRTQQHYTREALNQYWASPTPGNAELLDNVVAYGDISQDSIAQDFNTARNELCPSSGAGGTSQRTCHYSPVRECTDGWVRDGEWCCFG